jgi:hypothetical protein
LGEQKRSSRRNPVRLSDQSPASYGRKYRQHYLVDRKPKVGVSPVSRAHPDGLTRLSGSRASLIESSKSFITDCCGERRIIITVRSSPSCLLNEGRKKAQKGSRSNVSIRHGAYPRESRIADQSRMPFLSIDTCRFNSSVIRGNLKISIARPNRLRCT